MQVYQGLSRSSALMVQLLRELLVKYPWCFLSHWRVGAGRASSGFRVLGSAFRVPGGSIQAPPPSVRWSVHCVCPLVCVYGGGRVAGGPVPFKVFFVLGTPRAVCRPTITGAYAGLVSRCCSASARVPDRQTRQTHGRTSARSWHARSLPRSLLSVCGKSCCCMTSIDAPAYTNTHTRSPSWTLLVLLPRCCYRT